jgi:hypothetical protein
MHESEASPACAHLALIERGLLNKYISLHAPVGWASASYLSLTFYRAITTISRYSIIFLVMAPSALADICPIPARHYTKASTVVASVLHGPRDLRLVCLPFSLSHPTPTRCSWGYRSFGASIRDARLTGSNRKLEQFQSPPPMNSRSLSRLPGCAEAIAHTTASSATAISRPVSLYH